MIHRNLIAPSGAFTTLAKDLCAAMAPGSGAGMFKRGASPTGALPNTHYISTGPVSEDLADLLPLTSTTTTTDVDGVTTDTTTTTPGNPAEIVARAAALVPPVVVPLATITALLNAVDVSDGPPEAALARLNLKLTPW